MLDQEDLSFLLQPRVGIYQLCLGPIVVYVGKTEDLLMAISLAQRRWFNQFDRVIFLPCPPSEQLVLRAKLIQVHHPRLNIKQQPRQREPIHAYVT